MATPLDLLGMLHRMGYSIKESDSHTWYAYKYYDGKLSGYFSNDINELYKLCTHQCPIILK